MYFVKHKSSFINRAFPTPTYLSLDPVALDITPFEVRVMKLKPSKVGLVPHFFRTIPFNGVCDLTDSEITAEDTHCVVSALKKIKDELKLKYVIVALPEQKNYIFTTTFPRTAIADIASAVRFSLEENVPIEYTELNFDYYVANENEADKDLEVTVSVFPKAIIQSYTNILRDAGLTPVSFISESTSLANALIPRGDDRPFLILRMLEDRVNIAIVQRQIVQYTSTLSVKTKDVLGSFDGQAAKELKEALNKLLIFWFTSRSIASEHKKIEDIIVVGKCAYKEGAIEFLEKNLKVNVEVGNVWANTFSIHSYIPPIHKKESLDYAVVIGLALTALNYK
jgi:Tfp pilus assembly PilM family ATPase